MFALILCGAMVAMFGALYGAGVAGARRDQRRLGQWVEPPSPLPRARVVARRA